MKTVAIDIRLIGRNRTGDEAVFRNLVREILATDRANRYVLLTDRNDVETLSKILEAVTVDGTLPENAEIVSLPARNRFSWNAWSVPRFLLRRETDVFHTQYILPWFVPRRTKIVTHIHDVSFRAYPEYIGFSDRLFLSLLIPRTMCRSDRIVTPSRFTKDEIISRYGVSSDRIAVIPNAVDPSFLVDPNENDVSRAVSRNGLPDSYVLSVGTMQPRKNIPLLVHAFARVRKDVPELKLVLVGGRGGRHYDAAIDTAISDEGLGDAVIFPGYVSQEDMPSVYKAACVFAFPSLYEGFGIPILESFAVGTPVVTSDIAPFREVGDDAITTFDPKDVANCAEALYTLSTDENSRLRHIRAGKDRLRRYSWNDSAQVMVVLYESI